MWLFIMVRSDKYSIAVSRAPSPQEIVKLLPENKRHSYFPLVTVLTAILLALFNATFL